MSFKKSFKSRFLIGAVALTALTSCATLLEGSSQEVTFEAVGATNVMCYLKTSEMSYKVYPPQRVWLKRSRLDMTADCFAPGNRHKQFEIVTGVEPWAATNVSNGVAPGVTYDAYSRALFKYPEVVVFDMSDTVAKTDLPPGYENGDGINPRTVGIENMGPKINALPEDAINAQRRKEAFEQYNREEEFDREREERKAMYDPGVKK